MNRLLSAAAALTALCFCAAPPAGAMETSAAVGLGDLTISAGWVRPTIGPGTVTAAYLTIENAGADADALTDVNTDRAGAAELHTHVMEGGVMRMTRIPQIVIPPGATVSLEPGGSHIMLIDLDGPLGPGDEVELELTFENAGDVTVVLPVSAAAGGGH